MAERFAEVEKASDPSKRTLEERLKEYPELKAKIEMLLGMIENAGGDIEKAAEAARIKPDGSWRSERTEPESG